MEQVQPGSSILSRTRPYFPELDGVRAIATLMVMVFHFGQSYYALGILIFGQTGVDLFFVLSGFLITTILLQAPARDWHEVRNFYIRRTLRIFPLYYGYLILACIVFGKVSVWYWVYLQNIAETFNVPLQGPNHFWSLAVEEQFYLVWPFLVLFWPRRWLAGAMWGMIALSVGLRIVLGHTTLSLFPFTLTRLDGLAGGALLAYAYHRGILVKLRPYLTALGVAGLLSLVAEKVLSHGSGLAWVEVMKFSSATALYVAAVGVLLATGYSPVHRWLRSRPMRAIGRVSYGMYVFHPMVFELLPKHLGALPLLAKAAICFGAAYLVAVVSFYGFEKRFTDLKDRFAKEKQFRIVPA